MRTLRVDQILTHRRLRVGRHHQPRRADARGVETGPDRRQPLGKSVHLVSVVAGDLDGHGDRATSTTSGHRRAMDVIGRIHDLGLNHHPSG